MRCTLYNHTDSLAGKASTSAVTVFRLLNYGLNFSLALKAVEAKSKDVGERLERKKKGETRIIYIARIAMHVGNIPRTTVFCL